MTHRGGLRASDEPAAMVKRAPRVPRKLRVSRSRMPICDSSPDEDRLVHVVGVTGLGAGPDAEVAHGPAELAEQVLPLAHAEVVQELGATQLAELVRRQLALAIAQVVPQGQQTEQLGPGDIEAAMELVGLLALLLGTFARVLDGERGDDHHDVVDAVALLGLEHHAPESRVDR